MQHNDAQQDAKYLVFTLKGEQYGAPLVSIKEVIKHGDIKRVPYMADHFQGVINLRGQIVSIIDLRQKFGLSTGDDTKGLILIVECASGPLGAIIDDLVNVQELQPNEIEFNPALETRVPLNFFMGIGKVKDRLVNLVDLSKCLSAEELRIVKKAQVAA